MAHQGPGVNAPDAHHTVLGEPVVEASFGAPAAGHRRQLAGDHPTGVGPLSFAVSRVDAGVTQFRIGEGDQLAGIAGVGDDLLITGHACVEHHFADDGPPCSEALAAQQGAIGQDQQALGG